MQNLVLCFIPLPLSVRKSWGKNMIPKCVENEWNIKNEDCYFQFHYYFTIR